MKQSNSTEKLQESIEVDKEKTFHAVNSNRDTIKMEDGGDEEFDMASNIKSSTKNGSTVMPADLAQHLGYYNNGQNEDYGDEQSPDNRGGMMSRGQENGIGDIRSPGSPESDDDIDDDELDTIVRSITTGTLFQYK